MGICCAVLRLVRVRPATYLDRVGLDAGLVYTAVDVAWKTEVYAVARHQGMRHIAAGGVFDQSALRVPWCYIEAEEVRLRRYISDVDGKDEWRIFLCSNAVPSFPHNCFTRRMVGCYIGHSRAGWESPPDSCMEDDEEEQMEGSACRGIRTKACRG